MSHTNRESSRPTNAQQFGRLLPLVQHAALRYIEFFRALKRTARLDW